LFAFRWWREFEAAALRQLSNVGQIEADAVLIANQLRECALERPLAASTSSGESALNILITQLPQPFEIWYEIRTFNGLWVLIDGTKHGAIPKRAQ
jgi:hypothetical protein